ncbi:MAG: tetratricopeptide repeat protein [Myxococcota bacterium]
MQRLIVLVLLALAVVGGCKSNAEKADELYASALTASAPSQAIALLQEAIGLNPRLEGAHRELANVQFGQANFPAAIDAASAALAIQETAEARAIRGQSHVAQQNWDAAHEDLARAEEIDMTRTDLATPLGIAQRHLGQPEEALRTFERALQADPEDRAAALELVELQLEQANALLTSDAPFLDVRTALRRAQGLAPRDVVESEDVPGGSERWALEPEADDQVQQRWAEVEEALQSVEEQVAARQLEQARSAQQTAEQLLLDVLTSDSEAFADALGDMGLTDLNFENVPL